MIFRKEQTHNLHDSPVELLPVIKLFTELTFISDSSYNLLPVTCIILTISVSWHWVKMRRRTEFNWRRKQFAALIRICQYIHFKIYRLLQQWLSIECSAVLLSFGQISFRRNFRENNTLYSGHLVDIELQSLLDFPPLSQRLKSFCSLSTLFISPLCYLYRFDKRISWE